uniref:Uncharacterized protein n=1 Tax=Fusarium oxysporum f. sp. physali TaxID=2212625 RepID=A0A7U0Q6R4_FUSOX|nr:hypothetical protein [Fusarium oxysporum f. sp. physali]QQY97458.1 hypothetical protein [Fusarium oxysporum f. sp. physali]QQY97474.1 hypothetical protein [Fusarium oxysporum f. sp. physali]QQY97490.1 hypothetical protein [Fusarium oxysporum f. sp. physali]
MKSITLLALLPLFGVGMARKHRLCACESSRGSAIDDSLTQSVVTKHSNGNFVYSTYFWPIDFGAPYAGKYIHAIDRPITVNGQTASDDGFIGGDEIEALCIQAGAPHSTCFNPNGASVGAGLSYRHCGPGSGGCWTKLASDTDGLGRPRKS